MAKDNDNKPRNRNSGLQIFSPKDINGSTADVKGVLSKIFRKLVFSSGRNPVQKNGMSTWMTTLPPLTRQDL